MSLTSAVSALSLTPCLPTAYKRTCHSGNWEGALGRPRAGCERRVFGSGRPDAWTMARGARIGATTTCCVGHGSRAVEIAKCLIYNDSLFPVINITGNSGSLLADSDRRANARSTKGADRGPRAECGALARFHTINLAQNKNGPCSTWNALANPPPCF